MADRVVSFNAPVKQSTVNLIPFSTQGTMTMNDRFKDLASEATSSQAQQSFGMLASAAAASSRPGLLSQMMDLDMGLGLGLGMGMNRLGFGNSLLSRANMTMAPTAPTLIELLGSGAQGLASAYDLKELITRQQIIAEAKLKTQMMELRVKDTAENLIFQQAAFLASQTTARVLSKQPMDARAYLSKPNSFLTRSGRVGNHNHNQKFGQLKNGYGTGNGRRCGRARNQRQSYSNPSKAINSGNVLGVSPLKRLGTVNGNGTPKFVADKYTGTKYNTVLPNKETLDDDLDHYMAQTKSRLSKDLDDYMAQKQKVTLRQQEQAASSTTNDTEIQADVNDDPSMIVAPEIEYELSDGDVDFYEDEEEHELIIDEGEAD